MEELAEVFFSEADMRLAELREAAGRGDAAGLTRAAHTLKGASGNMGARRLAALCQELEEAGHSGDLSKVRDLLPDVETEIPRVRTEFARILGHAHKF